MTIFLKKWQLIIQKFNLIFKVNIFFMGLVKIEGLF
jgi:hypothetical protein